MLRFAVTQHPPKTQDNAKKPRRMVVAPMGAHGPRGRCAPDSPPTPSAPTRERAAMCAGCAVSTYKVTGVLGHHHILPLALEHPLSFVYFYQFRHGSIQCVSVVIVQHCTTRTTLHNSSLCDTLSFEVTSYVCTSHLKGKGVIKR